MNLHKATMDDAEFLFRLRNDPDTRKWSKGGSQFISWHEHIQWLETILNEDKEIMSVGPSGVVRISRYQEVGITVTPEYRGLGLAIPMLLQVIRPWTGTLIAIVHQDNNPSRRTFDRAGFTVSQYEGPWVYMTRLGGNS